MRREFRMLLAVAAVALPVALVSSPGVARAGITTELRTNPVEYYRTQNALFTAANFTAQGSSKGSSSSEGEGETPFPGRPGGPRDPRDPVMLLGADEYDQIEQGLITEEEALSGCGASVTGGPASLGALALVGLFLALRRRK